MSWRVLSKPPKTVTVIFGLGSAAVCFLEVPWFVEVFVAVCAQHVESAARLLCVVANKVCAVVQSFLASAAQTKLVVVAVSVVFVFVPTPMVIWCILAAQFPRGCLLALHLRRVSNGEGSRSPVGSRVCDCRHLFVRSLECTWSLHSTIPPKNISISFSNNGKSKSVQFSHKGLRHPLTRQPTA